MSEWRWNLYAIIAANAKTKAGQIASAIMPDVDEDKMFDSIRLSTDGNEPATHFATSCPLTKEQAVEWANLLIPDEDLPEGFPTPSLVWDAQTEGQVAAARANGKFIAVITRRLQDDHATLKRRNRAVVIMDKVKYPTVTQIPNMDDVFSRVGLVRIVEDDLI